MGKLSLREGFPLDHTADNLKEILLLHLAFTLYVASCASEMFVSSLSLILKDGV